MWKINDKLYWIGGKKYYNLSFNLTSDKYLYKGFILPKEKISFIFPSIEFPDGLNIFEQFCPSETQHSKILSNILDPNSKHGYGNIFLLAFFEILLPEIIFNKNIKWIVTAEKDRYDVRIRNVDNTVIVILENKSNGAGDQPNQLYRYWYNGIYKAQKHMEKSQTFSKILYISPNYNKFPDGQTTQVPNELINGNAKISDNTIKVVYFHDEIDKWLDKCLKLVDKTESIYYYIKQYKDYWRYYNEL